MSNEWAPIGALWNKSTQENRDALQPFFTKEATYFQCTAGVKDADQRVAPEAMALDQALLDRPQSTEIQLDLLLITKTTWRSTRSSRNTSARTASTLAVCGKNDPFFLPPGAEAYRPDNPSAKVVFYDTGHFALETHAAEISAEIRTFLSAIHKN